MPFPMQVAYDTMSIYTVLVCLRLSAITELELNNVTKVIATEKRVNALEEMALLLNPVRERGRMNSLCSSGARKYGKGNAYQIRLISDVAICVASMCTCQCWCKLVAILKSTRCRNPALVYMSNSSLSVWSRWHKDSSTLQNYTIQVISGHTVITLQHMSCKVLSAISHPEASLDVYTPHSFQLVLSKKKCLYMRKSACAVTPQCSASFTFW